MPFTPYLFFVQQTGRTNILPYSSGIFNSVFTLFYIYFPKSSFSAYKTAFV